MPQSRLMKLRICDDVRDGPRGPLLGRVLVNMDEEDTFYVAIPFSETVPRPFSTRWNAKEYVQRRGKPTADTYTEETIQHDPSH